jgi:hypothetical protein
LSGVTTILNFDGQSASPFVPPDTNGAAGTRQFVQIVNVTVAVYDKTNGSLLIGPTDINSIWKGFGGPCESGNGGDPIVFFDQLAGRWPISQLQFNVNFTSNQQCIAISTSADATGASLLAVKPDSRQQRRELGADAFYREQTRREVSSTCRSQEVQVPQTTPLLWRR